MFSLESNPALYSRSTIMQHYDSRHSTAGPSRIPMIHTTLMRGIYAKNARC
ncbi:Protein of unknown function [Pyronema omphalodes CBS 100304]|uniref:Uncharacterized protein n=1 Tax=Pyronema omphalodes (strain CBS 100304) TaxID=1076935 RepID=U4LEC1_PYROM|nr:Protein of unknown function [Pyronema omphalodes CBS 100304]